MLFVRPIVIIGLFSVAIAAAGRLDWTPRGLFLGLFLLFLLVDYFLMRHFNPELLRARSRHNVPSQPFDRLFTALVAVCALAMFLLAGLGVRFGWPELSPPWIVAGCVLQVVGTIPVTWPRCVNK